MTLSDQMKVCLASTFAYYLKAHNFHWNVTGSSFPQYHSFFETIYTDAWGAVDTIAEHIRTLNQFVPGSLGRYKELSVIEDETNFFDAARMVKTLYLDNELIIAELVKANKLAEETKKVGIANFLQDRIDTHEKLGWQLKATMS
jgi:starvation-inducible DNA-binding protein